MNTHRELIQRLNSAAVEAAELGYGYVADLHTEAAAALESREGVPVAWRWKRSDPRPLECWNYGEQQPPWFKRVEQDWVVEPLYAAPVVPDGMVLLDVVFDGPPAHESGRFVECEVDGHSVKAGEWVHRADGYWVLRLLAAAPDAKGEKS